VQLQDDQQGPLHSNEHRNRPHEKRQEQMLPREFLAKAAHELRDEHTISHTLAPRDHFPRIQELQQSIVIEKLLRESTRHRILGDDGSLTSPSLFRLVKVKADEQQNNAGSIESRED
jgi:hypothetical protein